MTTTSSPVLATDADIGFPAALLQASTEQRYTYFKAWRVIHPKLVMAKEALLHAIQCPSGQSLIQVFGCTGVGKTTLRCWVERLLLDEVKPQMQENSNDIPVASVIVPGPDQGPFSWRDIYIQMMQALGEPTRLINGKHHTQLRFVPHEKLLTSASIPRKELRLGAVSGLYYRRVAVLFLDEAQHFQMVTKAQRIQDQMDNLKWMADVSDTLFVLVGTYDLLNLTDLSGQLARRSLNIHFERYCAEKKEELRQFASIVLAFQRHLPLAKEPDLIQWVDYLYERSVGCVGILKDWITQALSNVLRQGAVTMTQAHLEACVDLNKSVAIAKEAAAGEQRIRSNDVLYGELKTLLKAAARARTHLLAPSNLQSSESSTDETKRPRASNAGRRHAIRDKVGHQG